MQTVNRIYVVKKPEYAIEANSLFNQIRENDQFRALTALRIYNRYDVQGLADELLDRACREILAEPPLDDYYLNAADPWNEDELIIAVEALPGQFDQRADSAAQCLQFLSSGARPLVRCAKVYAFSTNQTLSVETREELIQYLINPVESREASLTKPDSLQDTFTAPDPIQILTGFCDTEGEAFSNLYQKLNLAMSMADFEEVKKYFLTESRDPTLTEIRVLDTYWSDHCRHTTFLTVLSEPVFTPLDDSQESEVFCSEVADAYCRYRDLRKEYYGESEATRPLTLMDLGTIGAKVLRKRGMVPDLDLSEEINACSVKITLEEKGGPTDYLLMFKNETHNHPTEIEPYGGAATCLGGAIRDPLSGRSYVYQAMRVTGAADPRVPASETIPGKLSQRKICLGAAKGYSSYGNQIGLATGLVREIYHPNYAAKRMEVGAVIASAPADQVIRETPLAGDQILLIGGRTGRDGIGGATGSSKEHTEHSVKTAASEVQKGNPPEERKLQRLFRRSDVARLIKRCNDFGAGGVSVAIGELADSLDIDLDRVPLKYQGLDGTEIAISESQERMAVVLDPEDVAAFCAAADKENIEATVVATVTDSGRMRMYWRGEAIVDLSRAFIDTSGADQFADVTVLAGEEFCSQRKPKPTIEAILKEQVSTLNGCLQAGLGEMFDSSIGAATVLAPYGGRTQRTAENVMAALIPLRTGVSKTASLMAYGYQPEWTSNNAYRGSYLAVLDSLAKLWAAGADPERIRLSFQEYFPATRDAEHWGLPFQALLGALDAQMDFGAPSIGGKDSMSGTYGTLEVPPTLISFAVGTAPAKQVRSRTLQVQEGSEVFLLAKESAAFRWSSDEAQLFAKKVHAAVEPRTCLAASTVEAQGLLFTLFTMALGNQAGVEIDPSLNLHALTMPMPGAVLVETASADHKRFLLDEGWQKIAAIDRRASIRWGEQTLFLKDLFPLYAGVLEPVYPQKNTATWAAMSEMKVEQKKVVNLLRPKEDRTKPSVLIPVFPGTNCEYDSARAFDRVGGRSEILVLRNQTPEQCEESLSELANRIAQAQILFLPGGFSGGDEPEGSAKFITSVLRNEKVKEAILTLYEERDGLILGICNGFQALIKLGLLPFGQIKTQEENSSTLTFNSIGRHISNYVTTKIVQTNSPWLSKMTVGEFHTIPISHGEGRLVADEATLKTLWENGQVVAQYVTDMGEAAQERPFNPNGSIDAIEALMSPDGRILGKMGHSERWNKHVGKNVPGVSLQDLFTAGVEYFQG